MQEFDFEIKDRAGKLNQVADHLSRLEGPPSNPSHFTGSFPNESLLALSTIPWFAEIVNFKVTKTFPRYMPKSLREKILSQDRFYIWDDPYLWRICSDQIIRRCVDDSEIPSILNFCHSLESGGHFGPYRTAHKVMESGFYWPTIHKDAANFCIKCPKCQKTGNLSSKNQLSLTPIYVCELFDVWGVDFMGPFPPSYGYVYILLFVDYLSKWIEAIPTRKDDAQTVAKYVRSHIILRYGFPKILISDRGTHFCNRTLENLCSDFHCLSPPNQWTSRDKQ